MVTHRSTVKTTAAAALCACFAALWTAPIQAEENGRYQLIVAEPVLVLGESTPHPPGRQLVILLDTQTGQTWWLSDDHKWQPVPFTTQHKSIPRRLLIPEPPDEQ